jgi:predicted amidophosphoribosyltransferase
LQTEGHMLALSIYDPSVIALFLAACLLIFLIIFALRHPEEKPCPQCKKLPQRKDQYCSRCGYALHTHIIPPPPPYEETTLIRTCAHCHSLTPFYDVFCSNCGKSEAPDSDETKSQPTKTRILQETKARPDLVSLMLKPLLKPVLRRLLMELNEENTLKKTKSTK